MIAIEVDEDVNDKIIHLVLGGIKSKVLGCKYKTL